MHCIQFLKKHEKNVAVMHARKALIACNQEFTFNQIQSVRSLPRLVSNLEHSHLIDCTRQLHLGVLCVGIYKWAQSDQMIKEHVHVAVSEADLLSVL